MFTVLKPAAWTTLLTEGCYFLLTAGALQRFGYDARWHRIAVRPLVAALVFTSVLWLARGLPMAVAAAAASAAWGAATFALGVWRELWRTGA